MFREALKAEIHKLIAEVPAEIWAWATESNLTLLGSSYYCMSTEILAKSDVATVHDQLCVLVDDQSRSPWAMRWRWLHGRNDADWKISRRIYCVTSLDQSNFVSVLSKRTNGPIETEKEMPIFLLPKVQKTK